jgi:sterol desaturase/sphingolipid hydroxylase (fatty acid hydroxylase superfamily)
MHFEKINNKGQAQLFRNSYLEMLTKTHPLVIWGLYLPIAIGSLYYSGFVVGVDVWKIATVFFSGIFFWTFFEYVMHRFAFHHLAESGRAKKFVYIIHGNHHHYPRDKERLFMPPVPSLILASAIFFIQYLLLKKITFMFFPGFLIGYLTYGSMHYAIHAWNPPFKWMKPLWRNHHLHHYKDTGKGYGVSTTLWDRVFGTMFDLKNEKEDKERSKSLMYR